MNAKIRINRRFKYYITDAQEKKIDEILNTETTD